MRMFAVSGTGSLTAALLLALTPFAAAAQSVGASDDAAPATDQATAAPLDAHDSAVLGQALTFDPADLTQAPAKSLKLPSLASPAGPDVSGSDKNDGSGNIAIQQSLADGWNARVGIDLGVAAPPTVSYQPDGPLPGTSGANSGVAWASMDVNSLASINARIDPASRQGRIGTRLQHSLALGSDYSLTLRDDVSLSDALGASGDAATAPAGLPVMALPRTTGGTATEPVWNNKPGVQFNILPTGTTLAANLASASNDAVTHNQLSAEQKLYGPLHVTTSVTDLGESTVNKSITAGFKLNW